jgi:hypothetical protein
MELRTTLIPTDALEQLRLLALKRGESTEVLLETLVKRAVRDHQVGCIRHQGRVDPDFPRPTLP